MEDKKFVPIYHRLVLQGIWAGAYMRMTFLPCVQTLNAAFDETDYLISQGYRVINDL